MIEQEWKDEVAYIKRTKANKSFGNFNNDAACFQRYVIMQKELAEREGFIVIAYELQQVINGA